MDIRPQDLPEIRFDLMKHIAGRRGEHQFQRFDGNPLATGPTLFEIDHLSAAEMRRTELERLQIADLFFVSKEMTQLAREAARSVPTFELQEFDVPARTGFMLFAEPFAIYPNIDKPDAHIQACSWDVLGDQALFLSFYSEWPEWLRAAGRMGLFEADDIEDSIRADHWLCYETLMVTPLANVRDDDFATEDVLERVSYVRGVDQVLRSAWLLMQQSLAEMSEVQADRPARKRLRREGQEPASVRVIELRRPKRASGEPGESGRAYAHRWITRGHWRQ